MSPYSRLLRPYAYAHAKWVSCRQNEHCNIVYFTVMVTTEPQLLNLQKNMNIYTSETARHE